MLAALEPTAESKSSHEPNATVIRTANNPPLESQMSAEKAANWWAVKESNLQPTD
jgi:hypothetical protein